MRQRDRTQLVLRPGQQPGDAVQVAEAQIDRLALRRQLGQTDLDGHLRSTFDRRAGVVNLHHQPGAVHEQVAGHVVPGLADGGRVLQNDAQRTEHADVLNLRQAQPEVRAAGLDGARLEKVDAGAQRQQRVLVGQRARRDPMAPQQGRRVGTQAAHQGRVALQTRLLAPWRS